MKYRSLFLAVMALMTVSCLGGGPGDTVRDFYGKLEAGKPEGAMELLSSANRSELSEEKLNQLMLQATREIDGKGGLKKVEVTEVKETGDTATVTTKITFEDGTKETSQHDLVLEEGKWRIQLSPGSK